MSRPSPEPRRPAHPEDRERRGPDTAATDRPVLAAGGVLVDDAGRVAVVHRARYDDWSLPKGKVGPGESLEGAALREVEEETGVRGELAREVGTTTYRDGRGRTKIVRYWLMHPVDAAAAFVPNDEVDELRWCTPAEAGTLLSYAHDRDLVVDALERRGSTSSEPSHPENP